MLASSAAKWLPRDFVEVSQTGGVFTIIAYCTMLIVFICELSSFMGASYSTMLMLDRKDTDNLQINFDVDLHDIECRNLKVVVYAQSAQERLNTMAQDFWLRSIDEKGKTFGMAIKPQEITAYEQEAESEHERKVEKLKKEVGATELDADWSSSHDGFTHKSFDQVIEGHDFTMINFFAGWCSHCQKFAPAWDQIAKKVNGEGEGQPQQFADRDGVLRTVRLIRMNCVDFNKICQDKGIDAYPTIRLYKADGSFSLFDGKRDEADIIRWIERTIKMKSYGWASHHEAFERGCNAKGRLIVPRVPGHLELMAGGGDQNLNSRMTNVSHKVKHLSFSDPIDGKYQRKNWANLPSDMVTHLSPLDGRSFVTERFHEAWVHDMKVVSTVTASGATAYQFSDVKRLARLPEDKIPQAQFHYDIEPFSILVKQDEKKWYDFCTSLMAILGGAFVMMRLSSHLSLKVVTNLRHLFPAPRGGGRAGGLNIGHFE